MNPLSHYEQTCYPWKITVKLYSWSMEKCKIIKTNGQQNSFVDIISTHKVWIKDGNYKNWIEF